MKNSWFIHHVLCTIILARMLFKILYTISFHFLPSVGTLESDVVNGTALSTEFTLSAVEGWDDAIEDQPLLYSFGYYVAGIRHYLTIIIFCAYIIYVSIPVEKCQKFPFRF